MTIGLWAFYTGAGALGGIVVAVVAGGARFGIGQLALAFVTSTWLRLVITVVYVAPAMFAGYNATHGIAQMAKAFAHLANDLAIVGATVVTPTAFIRFTAMVAPGPAGRDLAQGYHVSGGHQVGQIRRPEHSRCSSSILD
ncbi:hypothetical protein [Bradyrhizobium sp. 164]|uniref:hypothetical protein n=1 Tax=Bradyrhizobium sp. 164 TaxID=2782637 RepID=UPI0032093CEA